jgi:hypothetical protein
MAAVTAIPSHPHLLTFLPISQPCADLINNPGNFMPRHARIFDAWPNTFFRQHIAVTDAASLNANSSLALAWLRYISFNKLNWPTRAGHLRGYHLCHETPPVEKLAELDLGMRHASKKAKYRNGLGAERVQGQCHP